MTGWETFEDVRRGGRRAYVFEDVNGVLRGRVRRCRSGYW